MRFVGLNDYYWDWVQKRSGCLKCEDTTGFAMIDDVDAVQAVVVLDGWSATACCLHIAVRSPMVFRRGLMEEIAKFVFIRCRRIMVLATLPENRKKALRLAKKVGFEELYRVKDGYDYGVDYVLLRIHKSDCGHLLGESE